jgi:hypothetical protein
MRQAASNVSPDHFAPSPKTKMPFQRQADPLANELSALRGTLTEEDIEGLRSSSPSDERLAAKSTTRARPIAKPVGDCASKTHSCFAQTIFQLQAMASREIGG